jgi:PAS domain S-box-containing protein
MENELTIGASAGALDSNRPLRLLIVEDSPADAELILAALKHAGTIVSCFYVVDSPALFRKHLNEADFDVILTDHNLITWTGKDSLEILQHSGKDIPLIVVTGSLGDEAAVEYIKCGAADYVLKEHLGRLPTAIGHALQAKAMRDQAAHLQAQILRAKRQWELTFDTVPDPVFVIGEDCRILRANRAASKVFGLAFDAIVGKHCYEVIHGTNDPLPTCPHQSLRETGQNSHGDIEDLRLGKVFYSSTSVISDPDGTLRGCVHVLHDVTERKRTEEALRRQALTFENIYDAVIVVDEDYNITDWNPASTRMFGYEKTKVLGRNVSCLHQPEVAERQMLSIKAGIESAGRWEGEYAFVRKDGTRGIAEIVIVPFRNAGGTQVGTVGVSRDITERKRAEEELRESEEKYRDLVENASYGIYRSTVEGKLLDVNPAFVAMLGYDSKEELLRVNLETGIYQNVADRKTTLQGYQNSPGRVRAETTFKRKDGALIKVQMDGRGVRGVDKKILYHEVIAEDVTQQRNLEGQFRQAQKMEAVGRLAGGIAHDFNNVLMIISSYAEMIVGRQTPDPAIQRYTEHIIQASKKATSLTQQLLAFSRKQMLQPAVLDLHAVVSDISNMLPPMLGEDIEMTIVTEPELGNVYADQAQIEQVLMNLAVNARDAMPKGGKLLIELHNVAVDDQYVQRHSQISPGAYVVLAVSDTGIGMDAATQANIFEPFFTTKEVGKGTGLGLSTVYGIVKQSGGFIWVYSEPGLGTTFKIYLPRVYEEAVAACVATEEKRSYLGNSETVLLVDDEPGVRCAAREFLEGKGYRVLEAENGAGALSVCTGYQGSIEVLLTDLIMPGMRGPELAAKVSRLYPEVKTVYMSGYTNRSKDIEDLGSDAVFLQKPFSLNTLAQKLHTALQHKNSVGGSDCL